MKTGLIIGGALALGCVVAFALHSAFKAPGADVVITAAQSAAALTVQDRARLAGF